MSNATKFFRNLIESALLSINTGMPCKVLSYNESTNRAKIQPLFMTKAVNGEPEPLPVIENVPVQYQRYKINGNQPISIKTDAGQHSQYQGSGAHSHNELTFLQSVEMVPDLKAGDVVWVQFAQRALDKVMNGQMAYPEINRRHSLNDAVITGLIK